MILAMPDFDNKTSDSIVVRQDVPLAPFTSFRIGGAARFFTTAGSLDQLRQSLLFARREGLPFCILGGGTNLLISDQGFDGVAIRMQLEEVQVTGNRIEAQAGVDLMELIRRTAELGLSGMESLAGIPGSVGGAVRGNAGAYGSCMADVTERVLALHAQSLELLSLEPGECAFQYRDSRFKRDPSLVVVSALLSLSPGDPGEVRQKMEATVARREARQLQCDLSAGSFFMNPVVTDPELIRRFETDQGVRCRECRIPAGWLIDQAGLRSTRVGGAMVNPRHANYLVNTGDASAEEMVRLASLVKRRVRDELGVVLREEVSSLGFTSESPRGQGC